MKPFVQNYRLLTVDDIGEWRNQHEDTDLDSIKKFAEAECGSAWLIVDRCGKPQAFGTKFGEQSPEPLLWVVESIDPEETQYFCDIIPAFDAEEATAEWTKVRGNYADMVSMMEAEAFLESCEPIRQAIQDPGAAADEWRAFAASETSDTEESS